MWTYASVECGISDRHFDGKYIYIKFHSWEKKKMKWRRRRRRKKCTYMSKRNELLKVKRRIYSILQRNFFRRENIPGTYLPTYLPGGWSLSQIELAQILSKSQFHHFDFQKITKISYKKEVEIRMSKKSEKSPSVWIFCDGWERLVKSTSTPVKLHQQK